ncbi:hypothetical protein OCGS_2618 [Oceaniovalibus guishaninsula JLT2003]|uniref:AmiS/UreI transporter n=1 Tax=Oceaniovalibus guishaninsula JLT2003 TaxID=1231392 RepID=K2GKJ4_9RHOB|nr:AmiS/UreI family transporter [Oceaniovalibus guishaninsula]EKE43281.1 hypothetical protein OCGS_2618 [Oceaniovalibus guishaninsula JLT2003]
MLLGLALLYVGVVLYINGLWMMDRIEDREIVLVNLAAAFVTLVVALSSALGFGADMAAVKSAALTLLFSTTYLWVAVNRIIGADGRGLGWFSLLVAITVVPVAVQSLLAAHDLRSVWLGLNWAVWAVLWAMYFALLALHVPIRRATAWVTLLSGIFTGWLPGLLLLNGAL